ncbi:MAG: hypothetical protein HYS21_10715 [Deltaproteobacteria bacterium]|nr:hypothetical protein [Deltaproteobacteria bacterium]
MLEGYSRGRIDLFNSLLKKRLDIFNGKVWTLEPKSLRFKHGESIAELKVPFHMGAEDEACIEKAILGLLSILIRRYEPSNAEGRKDAQPLPVPIKSLKEKTFRTDIFISETLEKKLASEILSSTPYVDSSIIFSWFTEGKGKAFIRWVSELVEKTIRDEAKHGGDERTSYLALLAVINTICKKKELIKGYRVRGLSYEKVDLVVGMVLFFAFKGALKDTLERLRDAKASCYNPSTETLLLSSVVPKSFISIQSNLLSVALNPYGINNEILEVISKYSPDFHDNLSDIGELAKETIDNIKGTSEALESIRQQYEIIRFREEAINYLAEFDFPGNESQEIIYEIYNEDRLIRNFLIDQKMTGKLIVGLEDIKEKFAKDSRRVEIISSFQRFLSSFKKSMLDGIFKSSRREAFEALVPIVDGYYACRLDDLAERYESLMRGYLIDRRDEFNQNMLIEEYNRGRLYRFSTDDRPVLKTLEIEEEGQLFIDMKDFTRKTLKVKEIAMAEFMREYFYKPILRAASQYSAGTGVGADERGIRLTNLPGDAAIFSGGVTYLVMLAKNIQQIIQRYREQLLMKLPPQNNEMFLEEVHKRFEERKEDLKKKRAALNKMLERNEHGVESKLVALGEEEHRLENTYRDELEAAIKGELEAGLYISYGSKAETMVIESRGEFSGLAKVSIGEKINEAARGTFRNSMVRAKLEVLLENERQKKKQKITYPFDIYIDRIYSIKIPPELDSAFEKLISNRKPSNAKAMAQLMANEYYNDLKKIISGEAFSALRVISSTTDIYNKGQALSINALAAYIKENKGTKWFFEKAVDVAELDRSIQELFFFPQPRLEFYFGVEVVKNIEYIEAFCKSGEVIFKGFEAATPMIVYEMLSPEGEFFKLLLKHHMQDWITEAKKLESGEAF